MKANKSITFVFSFLLVSCTQLSTPTVTDTPGIAIPPTETPTFTFSPSNTSTLTATFTPWYGPTQVQNRISTVDALFTKVYSFPSHCPPNYIYYGSSSVYDSPISPDGKWVINPCQLPSETSLEVMRLDGTKTWSISNAQLLTSLSMDPKIFHQYDITPLHWTKDSQQVYFSVYFCCFEPSSWPDYGAYPKALFRLDVQTGSWAVVTSAASIEDNPDTYSFSPTDRRLVYIKNGRLDKPLPLHIMDLKTGALDLVEIPEYHDAGSVVWSPDGLSFAFGAVHLVSEDHQVFSFSLFVYQIEFKTLKSLITLSPNTMYWPTDWSEDSRLTLSCREYASDYHSVTRRYMEIYDLNLGSISPVTPTP
jgi:hypothetical protein